MGAHIVLIDGPLVVCESCGTVVAEAGHTAASRAGIDFDAIARIVADHREQPDREPVCI